MPKYRKTLIQRVTDNIELDIRDMKIKVTWDFMKNFKNEMTYKQRVQYLSKEYSLSKSAIEQIVNSSD